MPKKIKKNDRRSQCLANYGKICIGYTSQYTKYLREKYNDCRSQCLGKYGFLEKFWCFGGKNGELLEKIEKTWRIIE
jgi:hypothetical protein